MRRPTGVGDQSGDGGREDHAPHARSLRGLEDVQGALDSGEEELELGVLGVLEGAGGRHVEDALAAIDGPGDGGGVEDVGLEEEEAGRGGPRKGEEVGGVGAGEDGGADGGVAGVQEGANQPGADEAVGSGDQHGSRFGRLRLHPLCRLRHVICCCDG